jgi:hypothetical protein
VYRFASWLSRCVGGARWAPVLAMVPTSSERGASVT